MEYWAVFHLGSFMALCVCVIFIVNDSLTQIYLSQVTKLVGKIYVHDKYIMSQMVIFP